MQQNGHSQVKYKRNILQYNLNYIEHRRRRGEDFEGKVEKNQKFDHTV